MGDFGWFVGTAIVTLRMNMRVFDPMTDDRDIPAFTDRVVLAGPMGGMIYKDLRVGLMLIGGYQQQSDLVLNKRSNAFINYTGFSGFIEYSKMIERRYPRRVPYLRVGYLVGLNVGTGELTLQASGLDLDSDYLSYLAGDTTAVIDERKWDVKETIPFYNPYVGVWLSPFDWLWFQIETGWMMPMWDTEDPKYELDSGYRMVDGDVMGGGLQIGIKIIVGNNPNILYEPPGI
jgi:hypothetical protein